MKLSKVFFIIAILCYAASIIGFIACLRFITNILWLSLGCVWLSLGITYKKKEDSGDDGNHQQ